uniref:CSON006957 protein n=1 Tax=Culicoides sonorensis TaxID=179676 RepID=A0A336M727_CULSO
MQILIETNCRICLAECLDTASEFKEFAWMFEKYSKIKYYEDDIPKKICDFCLVTIRSIVDFLENAEESDKILSEQRELSKVAAVNSEEILSDNEIQTVVPILENKVDKHSPKNKKNHVRMLCCDLCGKQINSLHFKSHIQSHNTKSPSETYFCDLCPYNCSTKDQIRYHMRHKHLNLIEYKCQYCDRSYQNRNSLKFHTSHTHTMKFSHFCSTCGKGFISASRLANHSSKHSDVRKYICNICGDAFKSPQYIASHKREVHSQKVFDCKECGKVFKCTKFLRQHQQFHKPHAFKCPKCSQTFSVGQSLKFHLRKSHPELPIAPPGSNLRGLEDLNSYLKLCEPIT